MRRTCRTTMLAGKHHIEGGRVAGCKLAWETFHGTYGTRRDKRLRDVVYVELVEWFHLRLYGQKFVDA